MAVHTHDPREHIRGLHQILISDKKRIGFLFGAGTSRATGIPDIYVPAVGEMTKSVLEHVYTHSTAFAAAAKEIQEEAGTAKVPFNIESFLSSIEAKRSVIGAGKLNGLDLAGFSALAGFVKKEIVKIVSVHELIGAGARRKLSQARLAAWVAKARRRFPAEIFTTNYDYLLEMALEGAGIPYFDGFSGSYEPFFCPEAVEDLGAYPQLVKLWKMHGSLGWMVREGDKAVVRSRNAEAEAILIYPSHLKYSTSKKQPYVGLIDRLCAFLQQDDAVLITCGYSFGDSHINERILTSLRRGGNSHVIATYYDECVGPDGIASFALEDESDQVRAMAMQEAGGKLSAYGIRHAVIGGRFGAWKLRGEPDKSESLRVSQYFDEDAAVPNETGGERRGDERWEGTGRLLLPNFGKLAEFLDDLSTSEGRQNLGSGR